jgi:hypothetical protein
VSALEVLLLGNKYTLIDYFLVHCSKDSIPGSFSVLTIKSHFADVVCCKPFNADGHNIYQKLKETGVYG